MPAVHLLIIITIFCVSIVESQKSKHLTNNCTNLQVHFLLKVITKKNKNKYHVVRTIPKKINRNIVETRANPIR